MPEETAQVQTPENKTSVLDKNVPNPLAKNPNVHTHKVFASVALILIGTIVILSILGYFYRDQVADFFNEMSASKTVETTKVSTSAARKATDSSKKDETGDWNVYSEQEISFKYPKSWYKGVLFGDGSDQGGGFGISFSNYEFRIVGDSATPLGSDKDNYMNVSYDINWSNSGSTDDGPLYRRQYDFVKSMSVGSTNKFVWDVWDVWNENLTREANTKVAGLDAVKYTTQSSFTGIDEKERKMNVVRVVFRKDNDTQKRYYKLDIGYYGQPFEKEARETLDNMLSTFKFL